ncbi:hypothetical protein [Saccharopolyspora phatthalungensis]|uniref:Uncharacterized protein n=1 Tax=Saccharopolyspora phatthalungensis TaxID=664693 RepID=A0A840QCI1_9PSEU|nr:hypothetical protein [Saccharopolyspora phatthalungensis]MBB5157490.1 hypothetical protein [Saccharopolyspora phatthalungensis]
MLAAVNYLGITRAAALTHGLLAVVVVVLTLVAVLAFPAADPLDWRRV